MSYSVDTMKGEWEARCPSFKTLIFNDYYSLSVYYSVFKAFYFSTDIISLGYSELSKSKLSEDAPKSSWPQGGLTELSDHVKQSV